MRALGFGAPACRVVLLPVLLMACADRATGLVRDCASEGGADKCRGEIDSASASHVERHLTLLHAHRGRGRWSAATSALVLRLQQVRQAPLRFHGEQYGRTMSAQWPLKGEKWCPESIHRLLSSQASGFLLLLGRFLEMLGLVLPNALAAALNRAAWRSSWRKEDDVHSIRAPSVWEDASVQRRRRRRRRPRRTEDDDDDDDEEERTGRRGWGYGRVLLVLILLVVVECFDDVVEDAGQECEDTEVGVAQASGVVGMPRHCHMMHATDTAQSRSSSG